MTFAHVAGVPAEELLLLWVAGGTGGGAVLARAWFARRRLGRSPATRDASGERGEAEHTGTAGS